MKTAAYPVIPSIFLGFSITFVMVLAFSRALCDHDLLYSQTLISLTLAAI